MVKNKKLNLFFSNIERLCRRVTLGFSQTSFLNPSCTWRSKQSFPIVGHYNWTTKLNKLPLFDPDTQNSKKKNRTASSKKFFNIFLILLRTFEFRRFSWEKDTLDRRKRKLPRETSVFHRFSMSLLSRVDSAFPAPSAHTHTHERDRERERNTWSGN